MTTSELQQAYVPLGTFSDNTWQGLGAGVLLVDLPVAWLVTTRRVLEEAGDRPLAMRAASQSGQVTLVDLSRAQREVGIEWLKHPDLDLAATLCPLQADWQLKGFSEAHIARNDVLQPPVPTCSLGTPPGQTHPLAFPGILSDVQPQSGLLLTSAPLLGASQGAPLLATGGLSGQVMLAGILTRTVLIPESDPRLPPLRLAEAIPATAALALIRSDAGRRIRDQALQREASS